MSFKRFANTHLNFSTREKTGIAGLLFIIALLYFLPNLLFEDKDYSTELANFEKQIAAMDTGNVDEPNYEYSNNDYQKTGLYEPFYFDPNTVDPLELEKFGVPDNVIARFTKYRNAGARFYRKEDLKKLYGLAPNLYLRMEPYIKIESSIISKEKGAAKDDKRSEPKTLVELNTADSLSLIKIKGIGPWMSYKILKYRDALGGYVNIAQLYEIYNIKPEMVDAIKPFVFVNNSNIKRINVNTATYNLLNGHPYISSSQANVILQYRKQHGLYTSRADLEKVVLLNKETLDKIEPYLEF